MELTAKQEKFAKEYVKLGDASAAYRLAYNTSNMKDSTVNEAASKLKNDYKVTTRIEELKKEAEKVSKKAFGVDIEWAVSKLVAIAEENDTKDRVSALDKLMKHLGGYEKDNDQKANNIVMFELPQNGRD